MQTPPTDLFQTANIYSVDFEQSRSYRLKQFFDAKDPYSPSLEGFLIEPLPQISQKPDIFGGIQIKNVFD